MAKHSAELRRCLLACDVEGVRRLWQHAMPHLPQPESDAAALISIHYARTQMASLPLKPRAYSHRWLIDNGFPSGLPDDLKPKAERIYPRIVDGVGIAFLARNPAMVPVSTAIRDKTAEAVLDCYANGDRDPIIVKPRMLETRARAKKYYADLIHDAIAEAARRK